MNSWRRGGGTQASSPQPLDPGFNPESHGRRHDELAAKGKMCALLLPLLSSFANRNPSTLILSPTSRGEKTALRGTDPESYITDCTLVYED